MVTREVENTPYKPSSENNHSVEQMVICGDGCASSSKISSLLTLTPWDNALTARPSSKRIANPLSFVR